MTLRSWLLTMACCSGLIVGCGKTESSKSDSVRTDDSKTNDSKTGNSAGVKAAPGSPEGQVQATVEDIVQTLKANDFKRFINFYLPTKEVVKIRESGDNPDEFAEMMKARGMARELADIFERAIGKPVTFNEDKSIATIDLSDAASSGSEKANLPELAKVDLSQAVPGFGEDLKIAISKANKSLADKDYLALVENLFPKPQVLRLKASGSLQAMADQVAVVSDTLKADFQELERAEAVIEGNTATYVIGPKEREIRFTKVDGSWRFEDNSTAAEAQLAELSKNELPKIQRGISDDEISFERLGNQWRIYQIGPKPDRHSSRDRSHGKTGYKTESTEDYEKVEKK